MISTGSSGCVSVESGGGSVGCVVSGALGGSVGCVAAGALGGSVGCVAAGAGVGSVGCSVAHAAMRVNRIDNTNKIANFFFKILFLSIAMPPGNAAINRTAIF